MKPAVAVLSLVAIGAFVQELYAQGGAVVAAPPQFQADYAFAGSTGCLHSASASCRRKPRSQSPSDPNAYFGNGAAPTFAPDDGSIRVRGDMAAVRLDARRTTIADVLAALNAAFAMSYRSSIALDEEINGTYAGSLRRVISRVLDGYNYVIKQDDAKLDVIILGRRGERAVPVAMPLDPFHPLRERRRPRLLGTDNRHG
ncbi:MAG: hypothetical protein WB764_19900 [Xanthobacteraceae bacterium]